MYQSNLKSHIPNSPIFNLKICSTGIGYTVGIRTSKQVLPKYQITRVVQLDIVPSKCVSLAGAISPDRSAVRVLPTMRHQGCQLGEMFP